MELLAKLTNGNKNSLSVQIVFLQRGAGQAGSGQWAVGSG